MKLYQERLMDHYKHPRHAGTLESPDFSTDDVNPSCGDRVAFQGIVRNDRLAEIAFVAAGCVICQATASLLAEWAYGKELTTIQTMTVDELRALVGVPLGPMRLRCALLPLQVLQQGVASLKALKEQGDNA